MFGKMDVLMNIFVILLSLLCLSSALYFHIGETEKKCFIEDIPDDTMVVGKALCVLYQQESIQNGIARVFAEGLR